MPDIEKEVQRLRREYGKAICEGGPSDTHAVDYIDWLESLVVARQRIAGLERENAELKIEAAKWKALCEGNEGFVTRLESERDSLREQREPLKIVKVDNERDAVSQIAKTQKERDNALELLKIERNRNMSLF